MTKRSLGILLAIILCMGMAAGCGSKFTPDESTVYVKKNGSVVAVDVEDFNTDTYDKDKLKEYVEDTVSEYNKENGKNRVKFQKLSVKDDQASLTMEYKTAADFRKFNGIDFFAGTLAEALAAGYSFDADFACVENETPKVCSREDFIKDGNYKVVIIKDNMDVKVKGKIAYVSTKNTALKDQSTVSIRVGNHLFGTDSDTQRTEVVPVTETTEAETAAAETETSVSEDELLSSTQEDSQVVFDFEDEKYTGENGEFSQVYTYIIYK